jgi:hypothetical protein
MPHKSKKTRITRKAACIRKTSNTARIKRTFLLDSKQFTPDIYTAVTSNKYHTLLQKIRDLDDDDMRTYGTKYKHFIFTDIREAAYGAKAIAGFLVAGGFDFRMQHISRQIRRQGKLITTKSGSTQLIEKDPVYGGSNSFALLQSLPLWKTPLPVDTKKRILTVFNSRPDNIHGERLRILVLDSKFKEGIDLFDVKYVHLMEPTIAASDLKQAVGRATRFCGQRGLHFIPQRGWPLQVYVYKTLLPQRPPFSNDSEIIESLDAHELMMNYSGLDLALLNTTKELTILAILSAVDYDLNFKINNFSAEPVVLEELEDTNILEVQPPQHGGGVQFQIHDMHDLTPDVLQKCVKRKSIMFPFTRARMEYFARSLGIKIPKGAKRAWYCEQLQTHPELYEALAHDRIVQPAPPPPPPPSPYVPSTPRRTPTSELETIAFEKLRALFPEPEFEQTPHRLAKLSTSMDFTTFQETIRQLYRQFTWESPIIENGCLASAIVPPGTPVSFTKTQDFIRHYLVPESPFKGLLAWHSVGTGKTCMAVAAATSSFEAADYTILWVTRNALMADVYKNIFGAVCSIPIADAVRSGKEIPTDPAARQKLLGRQWIKPISYKMFQNALEKKNELGRRLYELHPTDALKKTFLVIDEIHKLRDGDLSASEYADFNIIQDYIHKSYSVSGRDSVRPLLMTATPISDSPSELFDILNTLIPAQKDRFMPFTMFRNKFTNTEGEINSIGRSYFQERAKGLISYLNREYDPTTFAQPEFHTIHTPAGEIVPPTAEQIVDTCISITEPDTFHADMEVLDAERNTQLAATHKIRSTERKKAESTIQRTYKQKVAVLMKTRKQRRSAIIKSTHTCYKQQKKEFMRVADNVQISAIEGCFGVKPTLKFPSMRDVDAVVNMRLDGRKNETPRDESPKSSNAVFNAPV